MAQFPEPYKSRYSCKGFLHTHTPHTELEILPIEYKYPPLSIPTKFALFPHGAEL